MSAWDELLESVGPAHDFEADYLQEPAPVPTGIRALDRTLGGGFHAGLNVFAGGPGSFKTGSCVWWFHSQAMMGARPVYFSLEMTYRDLVMRMSAGALLRDGKRPFAWGSARRMGFAPLDEARTDEESYRAAMRYVSELGDKDPVLMGYRALESQVGGKCAIVDGPGAHDLGKVCGAIRALHEGGWRGIAYVDYMTLLDPGDESLSEFDRTTLISRELAQTARDTRTPIVAIYTLRKMSKREADEEPRLSWLRGTGSVGYDAETATIIMPRASGRDGITNISAYVVKNRHGECGEVDYRAQEWSGWVGE